MTTTFDWLLWTDGSGHTDGVWVSATRFVCCGRVGQKPGSTLSCGNCGTVNRAELQALLDGLAGIMDVERKREGGNASWKPRWPIRVRWFSDRENVVNGVIRDSSGKTLNSRRSDGDLWAAMEWYEKHFQIQPQHVPRNTLLQQTACDKICGKTRRAFKLWLHYAKRKKLII